MKKLIWVAVGLVVIGLIVLAVMNWDAFKITIGSILGLFGLGVAGKSALKAKKKGHEKSIKKRKKQTNAKLAKVGKRTSIKSRVANRNTRARKR